MYCQSCLKIGHDCAIKKGPGKKLIQEKVWKPTKQNEATQNEEKPMNVVIKSAKQQEEPQKKQEEPQKKQEEPQREQDEPHKETQIEWTVVTLGKVDRETRVKMHNAKKVRNKIGGSWNYMDNYDRHENGRIWLLWDHREVNLKLIQIDEQFIHVEIYSLDQSLKFVALVIYAFNQLDRRKELWNKIEDIGRNLNGPWIVIGDFNNVLNSQDIIGGNNVVETEVRDLKTMMSNMGLFEADMKGNHYTWSNKHVIDVIYSRIDRVIGNVDWFQKYQDASYEVLDPNISDHSPIKIGLQIQKPRKVYLFRFINCISKDPSFMQLVASSWHVESRGTSMEKLWYKIKRLQSVLRPLSKQFTNMQNQIEQVRQELHQVQNLLQHNPFDNLLLKEVKQKNEKIIQLAQMEEDILMQKSKVNWLKLGDSNNAYFHATVKEKNKNKGIYTLTDLDGNLLCTQESIEKEIVSFYKKLVGLQISHSKSKIYFGGVDEDTQVRLQQESGFLVGKMPFKYLGVPLDNKKLTISNGQPLIDKMLKRVQHWSSKLLSYAGRVQLINSVLFAIANYWLQIFPFPKKVVKHIEGICRSFLWTGKSSNNRKAPISWDHIYDPKNAGGLNLIGLEDWNKATIVWEKILRWIGYVHTPTMWDDELGWIVENTKGKGCKRSLMKLAVAKTVYRVWFVRNRIIFQGGRKEELHWETIKNVILRRVENNRKLMMYCNRNL
ncbi:putative ribonuclease H protein [Glycine soja]